MAVSNETISFSCKYFEKIVTKMVCGSRKKDSQSYVIVCFVIVCFLLFFPRSSSPLVIPIGQTLDDDDNNNNNNNNNKNNKKKRTSLTSSNTTSSHNTSLVESGCISSIWVSGGS
jgi:hypothetical protein